MDLRLSPDDRFDAGAKPAPKQATRSSKPPKGPKPPKQSRNGGGKPPRKKRGGLGRFFVTVIYFFATIAILGGLAVGGIIVYYGAELGSSDTWTVPQRPPNIRVLASNGQLLTNRGQTGGEAIAYNELPYYVPLAIIASEDRRFMSHFGVDPIGLFSVAVESIKARDLTRGASTLTQQVAKNLFLTPDQNLGRKVQEALLAVWLERNYTKEQIIELYMNRVHFGSGTTGIEAAAQTYFGISARNLSLGQAAMLAGILPAPSAYNPKNHPERAIERQRLALNNMVREGYITRAEADGAAIDPDRSIPTKVAGGEYYVADWVETLMNAYLGEVHEDVIVSTTIDWELQKHAEYVIKEAYAESGKARNFSQAAIVAMDVEGRVKALVGGVDYTKSQYNRAVTSRRQPGSAFKPIVYLTAIQQGYTPDTLVVDEQFTYQGWSPQNSNGKFVGPVLLRDALAYSINTVAARLAIDVGPEAVIETAYRLGFSNNFLPVPSIALGAQEVSLLELTSAFAPFANGGYGVIPNVITRITTTTGEVLYEAVPSGPGRIITDEQVGMMNDMLKTAVEAGTGRRAQIGNWPMAGKTGTSQRNRDAVFVGYTSSWVGGVWVGNDDDTPTNGLGGGSVPSQIWQEFMKKAHEGLNAQSLPGHYVRLQDRVYTPEAPSDQTLQPPAQQQDGIGNLLNNIFG